MAVAVQQQPTETAAEIIAALAGARSLPYAALPRAVARADEIAPAVIDVVEQAARGVFLMPGQYNLLFWGIHALAAARHTELYRPLLTLLHQAQIDDLDNLFGDAITETFKKVVISIFDGKPEPLIAACADKALDGFLRWNLLLALARLTFDGRIPREGTHAFLERFERESLADPGDPAWQGWEDAVTLLGVEDLRDRLHAAWNDGRNPHEQEDRDHFERQLTVAQSLAPGDPALFQAEGAVALDDPVAALKWTTRPGPDADVEEPDPSDPGGAFALKSFEIDWLNEFLVSSKTPPDAMMLEEVDGFFCALIAGPAGARLDDCSRLIWNSDAAGHDTPTYDSAEQEQYVQALLRRHWTTISLRLEGSYPHEPIFIDRRGPWRGRDWAGAFVRGMAMRETEWDLRIDEESSIGVLAQIVLRLTMNRD